ncbi:PE-PGRS family protein [Streptomyces sp. NA04227]|uniref:DUF5954 family protein n=1 Tax=Streptomyces sp. NA04227 TaxID=2742136 RepID=UPI001590BC59|nr:DUF5954 family protein [Streptomyces sp. NA04227]QKW10014.1 PE-PGRS family protein [Streptomyces sp. NA04227]
MVDKEGEIPDLRTIRMGGPQGPVEAVADVEAWQARERYPGFLSLGLAVFGVVRQNESGGWDVLDSFTGLAPQDGRDSMGSQFRRRAQQAEKIGDSAAHAAYMKAAVRMDWEAVDAVDVCGERYRVARAERFVRTGPDGPEPPRPTDPDPMPPGEAYRARRSVEGLTLDPATPTGMSEGILKMELLSLVRAPGGAPPQVRADSLRAARTHPGGVLIPATFMVAEYCDGHWLPDAADTCNTPQDARDSLARSLRVTIPWERGLSEREQEPYRAAADRYDARPTDELEVEGCRYRIVRVERLVRFGPGGPEGPRPSDPDPQPPVMVQSRQLGLIDENGEKCPGADDDEDEETTDPRAGLSPEQQRLWDLIMGEEARLRSVREERESHKAKVRGEWKARERGEGKGR